MLETVGLLVKPGPNARDIRLINKVRGSRMTPPINKLKFLVSHVITVAPNALLRGGNTWANIRSEATQPMCLRPSEPASDYSSLLCFALNLIRHINA